MAESVAEMLLKITGDPADAKRALLEVAKGVEQLDSTEGTATADVDAEPAERKLKDLFAEAARWAREKVTAKIDADTSAATTGMKAVEARADILDAKSVDVEVDVDTDRADRGVSGFIRKLGGVLRMAGKLNSGLGELSQAGFGAVTGGAGAASGAMDNFSGSVGTGGLAAKITGGLAAGLAAIIGPILVAAIGSAVVAIAALVASLALAAGALGILAAGFVAVLAPAVALGIGAIQRFKDTADIAGSAANGLKKAFEGFKDVFAEVVAPGADAVFRGMASALRDLAPILEGLGPGFTAFGKAVGGAIAAVGTEFARPVWAKFFRRLLEAATAVVGPVTDLFIGFLRVVRNLVNAALPLLAPLIQAAADAMKHFARNAGSAEGFSKFLGAALPHLKSWASLVGEIAGVFGGFLKAAAPFGKELVDWLAEGADKLGEWVNSAEGQKQIKQFFEDTLPLVKEVVKFFAQLALLAITVFQAIAPALQGVIGQMNWWLGLIQKAVNWFNTLSPTVRGLLFPLSGLAAIFGYLSTAVGLVIPAVKDLASGIADGLSGVVSDAVDVVKDLVSAIVGGLKAGVGKATHAATAVGEGIRDGIASVAGAVRDTVRGIGQRVIEIVRSFVENGRAAGTAVFTAVRNGVASVAGSIRDAARSILTAVMQIVRGFADNALNAGAHVFINVARGFASLAHAVYEVARTILREAMGVVRGFADNATDAGAHVFIGVARGFADVAQNVYAMARGIVKNAVDVIRGLSDAFYDAGKSLVFALARGIGDAAGAAIDRLKDLAGKLRGLLPHIGSFIPPKDRSSPLTDIPSAGEAIVHGLTQGLLGAAQSLPLAMADALSGITTRVGVTTPGVSPGLGDLSSALRSMPSGSTVGPTVNLYLSSLVPADSASLATIADVVTDALSRQGYRGAKVQVVG